MLSFIGVLPSVYAAGAISQSFATDTADVRPGTLLSFVSDSEASVGPASSASAARLIGVADDEPLVELSSGGSSTVQVVVGGTAQTLVSDINGPVKVGDKITVSPVEGIGMKAVNAAEVVGTAQAALDSVTTVEQTVAGHDGSAVVIRVGLIPVAVDVSYYAASAAGGVASLVPPFLQRLADSLTGRQISPLRVLLGAATLLFGFIAVIVMLSIAVRNGVVSIGRNPLAESALRKGIFDVALTALGVLAMTVGAVCLILFT